MTTIILLGIIILMGFLLYKTGVYSNFVFWIAGVLTAAGAGWENLSDMVAGWF